MDETITLDDWIFRVHQPQGAGPLPVVLLLHGWTGDENSMWIFTSRLPGGCIWLAPRGRHPTALGGYAWQVGHEARPTVADLRPAVEALEQVLQPGNFPRADFSRLSVVGFSQGSALAYTFALLRPERVRRLGGLAGFMPEDAGEYLAGRPLEGLPVFVAHGTQDKLVPVQKGRQAVEMLERGGAQVTYCEDTAGHRLSANCFSGFKAFFANLEREQ